MRTVRCWCGATNTGGLGRLACPAPCLPVCNFRRRPRKQQQPDRYTGSQRKDPPANQKRRKSIATQPRRTAHRKVGCAHPKTPESPEAVLARVPVQPLPLPLYTPNAVLARRKFSPAAGAGASAAASTTAGASAGSSTGRGRLSPDAASCSDMMMGSDPVPEKSGSTLLACTMVTHVRAITGYFWQQATLQDCFTFMVESQVAHVARAEEQSWHQMQPVTTRDRP